MGLAAAICAQSTATAAPIVTGSSTTAGLAARAASTLRSFALVTNSAGADCLADAAVSQPCVHVHGIVAGPYRNACKPHDGAVYGTDR